MNQTNIKTVKYRLASLVSIFIIATVLLLVAPTPVWARVITGEKSVTIAADEVIDDDLFIGAEAVNILGTVNGDVYVGGGTVDVSGTINGDLLAGGGTIQLSGTIGDDVRMGGGTITITQASIQGSLTSFGGTITVDRNTTVGQSVVFGAGTFGFDGATNRNLLGGAGTVRVNGTVGRDLQVGAGTLQLGSAARVGGNVEYSSDNEATIEPEASISGSVRKVAEVPKQHKQTTNGTFAGATVGLALWSFLAFLVVGLGFLWLFPNFSNQAVEYLRTQPGWAALWGIAFLMLGIPILIGIAITIIGLPLAFIGLVVWILTMYLAKLIPALYLGSLMVKPSTNSRIPWLQALVGLAIYYLVGLVPVLGWMATFIATLLGIGSLLGALWERRYQSAKK